MSSPSGVLRYILLAICPAVQFCWPTYVNLTVLLEQAAKEILRADENVISYLLGGITVGTAVIGTLGGGMLPVC